jgi:hypothetical protein
MHWRFVGIALAAAHIEFVAGQVNHFHTRLGKGLDRSVRLRFEGLVSACAFVPFWEFESDFEHEHKSKREGVRADNLF